MILRWYNFRVQNERSYRSGFSGIGMTAVLSVMALVGVVGWKTTEFFQSRNAGMTVVASAAASGHSGIAIDDQAPDGSDLGAIGAGTSSSSDPLSASVITDNVADALANQYASMQASGTYSTSSAAAVSEQLGENIKADVAYKTYTASDIDIDKGGSDTSYARMLTYRAALQTSLAPLLKNTTPELGILTSYVQTNDPKYLTELEQAADNYKLAASETASVVAPADAANVQAGILNAMNEFGATLSQMAASANDPFAEATLLNTYMQAQNDMFSSFNDLYAYYKSKQS
jgi:hypothetical protein